MTSATLELQLSSYLLQHQWCFEFWCCRTAHLRIAWSSRRAWTFYRRDLKTHLCRTKASVHIRGVVVSRNRAILTLLSLDGPTGLNTLIRRINTSEYGDNVHESEIFITSTSSKLLVWWTLLLRGLISHVCPATTRHSQYTCKRVTYLLE